MSLSTSWIALTEGRQCACMDTSDSARGTDMWRTHTSVTPASHAVVSCQSPPLSADSLHGHLQSSFSARIVLLPSAIFLVRVPAFSLPFERKREEEGKLVSDVLCHSLPGIITSSTVRLSRSERADFELFVESTKRFIMSGDRERSLKLLLFFSKGGMDRPFPFWLVWGFGGRDTALGPGGREGREEWVDSETDAV